MTTMELRKSGVAAASATGSFLSLLRGLVEQLFVWQERWEQRERLSGLDEHILRDIGLSRADALRESDKPFWRI